MPGLIFEIRDSKENFIFKLTRSQKLEKTFDTADFLETFAGKKPLEVKIATLHKLMLEFYNDPLQNMREKFDSVEPGTFKVAGVEVRNKDQFKDLTKKVQQFILKSYNPLDLDNAVVYPAAN